MLNTEGSLLCPLEELSPAYRSIKNAPGYEIYLTHMNPYATHWVMRRYVNEHKKSATGRIKSALLPPKYLVQSISFLRECKPDNLQRQVEKVND